MKYYEKEMTTIHPDGCEELTWEDAEECEKLNQECGWGFGISDIFRMLADHMDAHNNEWRGIPKKEAKKTQEIIEWRLEDANFSALRKLLHNLDYENAVKWAVNAYTQLEVE